MDAPSFFVAIGAVGYGLPVLLLAWALGGPKRAAAMRRHQRIGPMLGIALGLWIFGLLWQHHRAVGSFSWDGEGVWPNTAWVAFIAMWVAHIHVEIWGFEPLRRAGTDTEAYARALTGLRPEIWLHCSLLAATLGFAICG
jgi:hypothetical protein